MELPSLGWSEFARRRYQTGGEHSYFMGTEDELLELVRGHWSVRRPGAGRTDVLEVVVVPVPSERFVCGSIRVDEDTELGARYVSRQAGEDGYIEIIARGPRQPARHAAVVLYSAATLVQNEGLRSGEYDWEVVSIQASPVADEPMHPLTMARNMLAKPGGTPCTYTAQEFVEAVYYWSQRARPAAED